VAAESSTSNANESMDVDDCNDDTIIVYSGSKVMAEAKGSVSYKSGRAGNHRAPRGCCWWLSHKQGSAASKLAAQKVKRSVSSCLIIGLLVVIS